MFSSSILSNTQSRCPALYLKVTQLGSLSIYFTTIFFIFELDWSNFCDCLVRFQQLTRLKFEGHVDGAPMNVQFSCEVSCLWQIQFIRVGLLMHVGLPNSNLHCV